MMIAIIGFTGLGLALGSFINALVWRLRQQSSQDSKKRKKTSLENLSIVKGRSMCPQCRHELAPRDLVPVFSWMWLRGRCRYCSASIGMQYPLVELGTATIFALSYLTFANVFETFTTSSSLLLLLWLLSVVLLVALFVYDFKWLLLPSKLLYALIGFSSLYWIIETFVLNAETFTPALVDLFISQLITFGFFLAIYGVSRGRWLGFGDVLLAIAIGFLFEPLLALLAIVMPFYLGTLFFLPSMLFKRVKMQQKVPFGPFIITSIILTYLYGMSILRLLASLLGFPEVN